MEVGYLYMLFWISLVRGNKHDILTMDNGDLYQKSNSQTFTLDVSGEKQGLEVVDDSSSSSERIRSRKRRAAVLSASDKALMLDTHNDLRRLQNASNMEHMIWNDYLASMADDWADACDFNHGQPSRNSSTLPFDPLGQNLYLTSANTINIAGAITAWYNEIRYYTYAGNSCSGVCGHYTQVVWDDSREVGCGYSVCSAMTGTSISSGTYLVCNYGPAGNYIRNPFTQGDPCTNCGSGVGLCKDKLCYKDCTPSDNCVCNSVCENCGTVNTTSCTCNCAQGWLGSSCSQECGNYHANCGANPGWPKFWCDDAHDYVLNKCPLFCDLCAMQVTPCVPLVPNLVQVGVIIHVAAPIAVWDLIWKSLKVQLVPAVDLYCNNHVSQCCPGTSSQSSGGSYNFTSMDLLTLKAGDPTQSFDYTARRLISTATVYATGVDFNELCASQVSKRSLVDIKNATIIHGDVVVKRLFQALSEVLRLHNVTLTAVQIGEHEYNPLPDTQEHPKEWISNNYRMLICAITMSVAVFVILFTVKHRLPSTSPHTNAGYAKL